MKRNAKMRWERAYRAHVLWDNRGRRLARVQLVCTLGARRSYAWQTAGANGVARELRQARRLVEFFIRMRVVQYDLFDAIDPDHEFVELDAPRRHGRLN